MAGDTNKTIAVDRSATSTAKTLTLSGGAHSRLNRRQRGHYLAEVLPAVRANIYFNVPTNSSSGTADNLACAYGVIWARSGLGFMSPEMSALRLPG
jgi:hypothetical protein